MLLPVVTPARQSCGGRCCCCFPALGTRAGREWWQGWCSQQCQRDGYEKHFLCVPRKELSAEAPRQEGGILIGWQRAEGWSGCPPAAPGFLALRQPQAAQSVQEVRGWGGTEGALGQHQLLQVDVEWEVTELPWRKAQPGQQLLVQRLQCGWAAQWDH